MSRIIPSYRLRASLEEHIQKWMDENCEKDDWLDDMVVGNETTKHMCDAAFSVYCAIAESIRYGKDQGFLEEK